MLDLTLFPALDGDSLLLAWGDGARPHHLLVDLGRGATWRAIRPRIAALRDIELFVVSHIDADHIAGAMPLVAEAAAPFAPQRVWFNARPQLVAARDRAPIHEPYGARQGEKLSRGIVQFGWPWNREFASEIVSTDSAEAKSPLPLGGGLTIRLLSPRDVDLAALLPVWDDELERARLRLADRDEEERVVEERFEPMGRGPDVAKLAAARYTADRTEANGSSIAFIAEYAGKRVLFAADAHAEVLAAALAPLAQQEGGRCRIDLVKLSHHGSSANTSPELLELIDCTRFAISTDGSRRHAHPHAESIARILHADRRPKTLYFNYRQPQTSLWDSRRLTQQWSYGCVFPVEREEDAANGTLVIGV